MKNLEDTFQKNANEIDLNSMSDDEGQPAFTKPTIGFTKKKALKTDELDA